MDSGKYNRDDKIRILKGLMTGEKKLADVPGFELKYSRLTRNEALFLFRILQKERENQCTDEQRKTIIECLKYYQKESNKRPKSQEEIRGFHKATDKRYQLAGTNAIVMKWHDAIGLNLYYELDTTSEPTEEQNITNLNL